MTTINPIPETVNLLQEQLIDIAGDSNKNEK